MSSTKSQPKVTVFRGCPGSAGFAPSQFVCKLEARLRFASITYTNGSEGPLKAPRGKIPFVSLTKTDPTGQPLGETTKLSDSTLIAEHFVKEGLAENLNSQLSPAQKVQDLAIRALMEERLYWFESQERIIDNFYAMRSAILWSMPYPLQIIVGLLVYRQMNSTLWGQGTGRYTPEERSNFRLEIWQSIETLLGESRRGSSGDGPFWVLGGASPTEADTTVFGFIASDLTCPG